MLSRSRTYLRWILQKPQVDIVAVACLLVITMLYIWMTNNRHPLFDDQGWYLQVSARVMAGEVLYKDVWWAYPPLPVYILSFLFKLLGVKVTVIVLLGQILATMACLLTYRVARFLLSAPWAFLGTAVIFLTEPSFFYGGFISYIYPYTGGISLGAVMGLIFIVGLFYYIQNKNLLWITISGIATGGCFLSKPELALASIGTGLFFLTLFSIFPACFASTRREGIRALICYFISIGVITGIGYGYLVYMAGWEDVWRGISGYGIDLGFLLRPPWGSSQSWVYIISGVGVYLLIGLVLIGVRLTKINKRLLLFIFFLVIFSVGLTLLPWCFVNSCNREWILSVMASKSSLIQLGEQILYAPGTLVLSVLILIFGIHWFFKFRSKDIIEISEIVLIILAVYSSLVAVRFFFNINSLIGEYVDTCFPVLIFLTIQLIPEWLGRRIRINPHPVLMNILLVLVLCITATAGLALSVKRLFELDYKLLTPHGEVFTSPRDGSSWEDALQYILTYTDTNDPIVILDNNPEIYFLTGRRNPLRQDYFKEFGFSSSDVKDIIQRLKLVKPRLIIAYFWINESEPLLSGSKKINPDEWARYQPGLAPVWQYINDNYRISAVLGKSGWAYVVFRP